MSIVKRRLGKTGEDVTVLGLGGEGVLRTFGREREAYELINLALDLGINYFDSAKAYSGSESYYGAALGDRREEIFLTSKSHARDKQEALLHLQETLENMKTDYLDLWQIHDVRTKEDVEQIFGPGGAIEAFIEAKEEGLTRFVGVTGHLEPNIIRKCLERYEFDTVLVPLNPAESGFKSFIEEVVPLALKKRVGIIGMKVYLKGLPLKLPKFTSLEPFFRYALSHPISTAIIGCDNTTQLKENLGYAASFKPLSEREREKLEDRVWPYARQLMYYKQ